MPATRLPDTPTLTPQSSRLAVELSAALAGHAYLKDTQIVENVGGLPLRVQSYLASKAMDLNSVKGAYTEGKAYLLACNLASVEEGIRQALHEMVGHVGLRSLLGGQFEPVMLNLYENFPRQHDAWQTVLNRYAYLDTGTEAGKVAIGEELTAFLAETDAAPSELDMIKAEVRNQIRIAFPDLPMTEADVKALIQRSRESLLLRHGSPREIAEVIDLQATRQKVADHFYAYRARNGKGVPDATSLTLYRQGSRVVDGEGIPCRLYHGAGKEIATVNGILWGSVDPALASDYAEMRLDQGRNALVVPFYADIKRPFDGDALKDIRTSYQRPNGLSVQVFVEEVILQGSLSGEVADQVRDQANELKRLARREESGPTYSPHDFWYMSHWSFGLEGAELLRSIFQTANFDGVRYTEQGQLTYGAFSTAQIHFLDQGATPHGMKGLGEPQPVKAPSLLDKRNFVSSDLDIRLSFAGERANTANHLTLAHAQSRLARGDDPEQVRQSTGWFKGVDNRWRFEIADDDATLLPALQSLAYGKRQPTEIVSYTYLQHDNGRYSLTLYPPNPERFNDLIELVEIDRAKLEELMPEPVISAIDKGEGTDIWGGMLAPELEVHHSFTFPGLGTLNLDDVLVHPELFRAYPQLRNVKVLVDLNERGAHVAQGPNADSIYICLGPISQRSCLIHEAQHLVQAIEDFARGGSQASAQDKAASKAFIEFCSVEKTYREAGEAVPAVLEAHQRHQRTFFQLCQTLGLDIRDPSIGPQFRIRASEDQHQVHKSSLEAYYAAVEQAGGFEDPVVKRFVKTVTDRTRAYAATLIPESVGINDYLRLAGEVEARNVQSRLDMSPAERLKMSPQSTQSHPQEDQIIEFYPEGVLGRKAASEVSHNGDANHYDNQPDIRLSFAGESARTANRLTLDYAKLALSAGMHPGVVYEQTGWERGVDGRWRFEIDDSEASIAYGEPSSSNADAYIDWIDEASSRERGVTITQVLKHPPLFEAYPLLKAFRVKVVDKKELREGKAAMDFENRTVKMIDPFEMDGRTNGTDTVLSILLHELAHSVQFFENFAQGSRPSQMGSILDAAAFEELATKHDALLVSPLAQANSARFAALREQWQGCTDIPDDVLEEIAALKEAPVVQELARLQRQAATLKRDKQFGGTAYNRDELFHGYQRVAGEVEARNVQTRARLSSKERQAVPAAMTEDVPRDRQLLVDKAGKHFLPPQDPMMSLSRIDPNGVGVINDTNSGTALQQAASELQDLLDDAELGVGWMDGGCRMWAEALRDWSDGKIMVGVTSHDQASASHAVGVLPLGSAPGAPCALLDADGLATPKEMLLKLDKLELSPHEQIVAIGERAEKMAQTLLLDEGVTSQTVRSLELALGSFQQWEAGLLHELKITNPDIVHNSEQDQLASPTRIAELPQPTY